MMIEIGSRVLAPDYALFKATRDLDKIDAMYKQAEVLSIRPNDILCDVKFLHSNRVVKGVLIASLRHPS